jgi:hypothetical protein
MKSLIEEIARLRGEWLAALNRGASRDALIEIGNEMSALLDHVQTKETAPAER